MKKIEVGGTAYTLNGERVEVTGTARDGFSGCEVYESEGEEHLGPEKVFHKLYQEPPTQILEEQIARLTLLATETADELSKLRKEKRDTLGVVRTNKRIIEDQARMAALDPKVLLFLQILERKDKDVWYVGHLPESWRRARPLFQRGHLKKLSARLEWKHTGYRSQQEKSLVLNGIYKEGFDEGYRTKIEGFSTKDDALAFLQTWINSEEGDSSESMVKSKEATAKEHGLAFPDEKRLVWKRLELDRITAQIARDKEGLVKDESRAEKLRMELRSIEG